MSRQEIERSEKGKVVLFVEIRNLNECVSNSKDDDSASSAIH